MACWTRLPGGHCTSWQMATHTHRHKHTVHADSQIHRNTQAWKNAYVCNQAENVSMHSCTERTEVSVSEGSWKADVGSAISAFLVFYCFVFFLKQNFGFKRLWKGNSDKISFVPFHSFSQWCSRSVLHYKSSAAFSFTAVHFSPPPPPKAHTHAQPDYCMFSSAHCG